MKHSHPPPSREWAGVLAIVFSRLSKNLASVTEWFIANPVPLVSTFPGLAGLGLS